MTAADNPYVGPRAFETDEVLYGRERELRQLESLLIAERIVLLHSPSGAGKTSLIQAGLVPSMREQDFNVLPKIRVNLELPVGLPKNREFNRYLFSTLVSLEESLERSQRTPLDRLLGMTLDEYLTQRPHPPGNVERSDLLIFDQFEEILTVSPADRGTKLAFFSQLGVALRNHDRWALLAMREDFLGALSPYVRPIPGQLETRYRLDLLGPDAARQAIQRPARSRDVEFSDEAACKLVDDLRVIHLQQPDGSIESTPGPYVEPVQLQVVCYRLWETREVSSPNISLDQMEQIGNVDQSLADYYALSVRRTAEEMGISERAIREWFETELITKEGIRGQVRMGSDASKGLPNPAVRLLENAHIIRGEQRAGATWFELAHDRLIEPVRKDNAAWFEKNLSLFQRRAALWAEQGRSEGLLLRGKELEAAEKESESPGLLDDETAFLAACRSLRQREQRDRRRNTFMTILAIGATLAMIVAAIFWLRARSSAQQAKDAADQANKSLRIANTAQAQSDAYSQKVALQARQSRVSELGAQAQIAMKDSLSRGLLLALEAIRMNRDANEPILPIAYQALRDGMEYSVGTPLSGGPLNFSTFAVSPDGRWIAVLSKDGGLQLWDLRDPQGSMLQLRTKQDANLGAIAFSRTGRWLVGASYHSEYWYSDRIQNVLVWDMSNVSAQPAVYCLDSSSNSSIASFAVSPDERWLAVGINGVTQALTQLQGAGVSLFPLSSTQSASGSTVATPTATPAVGCGSSIQTDHLDFSLTGTTLAGGLSFNSTGDRLVAAATDHNIYVWQVPQPSGPPVALTTDADYPISRIKLSPDGAWMAAVGNSTSGNSNTSEIYLYQIGGAVLYKNVIPFSDAYLIDVLFSSDSKSLIAVMDKDCKASTFSYYGTPTCNTPSVVSIRSLGTTLGNPLEEFQSTQLETASLAISPSFKLAVADAQGNIQIWDLNNVHAGPLTISGAHRKQINLMLFSSDGSTLFSGGGDGLIRIWQASNLYSKSVLTLIPGGVSRGSVSLSDDGQRLVASSGGGNLYTWNTGSLQNPPMAAKSSCDGNSTVYVSKQGGWFGCTSGNYNTLSLWSTSTAVPDWKRFISAVAFSPDEKSLALALNVTSYAPGVEVHSLADGSALGDFPISDNTQVVLQLRYSSDGSHLLGENKDGIYVWQDVRLKNPPVYLKGYHFADSLDAYAGNLVTLNDADTKVQVWTMQDLSHPAIEISPSSATITASAMSLDGHYLATAGEDRVIRVFDLKSGNKGPVALFEGHTQAIAVLRFSRDGRWLASGSDDFTIRLWDMLGFSSTPVVLRGHTGAISFLGFTADGSQLISAAEDGSVRAWLIDLEQLTGPACDIAGRNLTQQEWAIYFPEQPYHQTCTEWAGNTSASLQGTPSPAQVPTPNVSAAVQTLQPPTPVLVEGFIEYDVQAGDNLYAIAEKFGVQDVNQIIRDNSIYSPNAMPVGLKLRIRTMVTATYGPSPTAMSATSTPTQGP